MREDQQAAPAEPTLIWTDEQFSMVRALNTAAHTRRCPQCGRDCRQDEGDPGGVMQEERRAQLLASQTTASRQVWLRLRLGTHLLWELKQRSFCVIMLSFLAVAMMRTKLGFLLQKQTAG